MKAFAVGAMATAMLRAANAARNRFFIGIPYLWSGGSVRLQQEAGWGMQGR
jgi:hypothetical protein